MKSTNILWGIGAAMAFSFMFSSCSNDLLSPDTPGGNGNLATVSSAVAAPDAIVWSGNETFGNTFTGARSSGTRADDGVVTSELIESKLIDRDKEKEFLDEKLPEEGDNLTDDMNLDFLFYTENEDLTFEIYPVLSQTSTVNCLTVFYFNDPKDIKTQVVWAEMSPYNLTTTKYEQTDEWIEEGRWDNGVQTDGYYKWDNVVYSKGVKITVKAGYYFGFIWNGNYWPVDGETGTATQFYTSSEFNPRSYKTNGGGSKLEPEQTEITHAVMFQDSSVSGKNKTYLGFEDWNDFDYQDWVFTCDVALPHVNSSDILGDTTPPAAACPKCGHTDHLSPIEDCDECRDDPRDADHSCWVDKSNPNPPTDTTDPTDPDPKDPAQPSTPGGSMKPTGSEVVIYLALNDIHNLPNGNQKYDIADLVSKLSMHVRYPHDVEVILPVPESIYCNQDDLYILNDHYYDAEGNPNWTYGSENNDGESPFNGEEHILSFNVGGHTVDLIITYVPASEDKLTTSAGVTTINGNNYRNGYISVRTNGINEDVIKYCQENYGDGINFEVYNYYNRGTMYTTGSFPEITFEELQYHYLSRSLVNFDWQNNDVANKACPDFYINAFNRLENGVSYQPNYADCYVWILGDEHARANDHGLYTIGGSTQLRDLNVTWTNTDSNNYDDMNIEFNHFFHAAQGEHYNNSAWNWIYTNKDIVGAVEPKEDVIMPKDGNWPFAKSASTDEHQYFKVDNNIYNYWDFGTNSWK